MRKRLPVTWLVIIDILLIAAGAGAFYLYLAVVPQAYEVVTVPTVRVHATAVAVAVVRPSVAPEQPAPTLTPTATATLTFSTSSTSTVSPRTEATALSASNSLRSATLTAMPPSTATLAPSLPPTSTRAPATATQPSPTGVKPQTVPRAGTAGTGAELGNGKFADKFTSGNVEQTATSYRSADINVTLTKTQRKGVTYYVQDIYLRYVDNLRTAFARNTYGRAISAWDLDIANANNAIGAINGDWYGTGIIGAVIRNGVLYHARAEGDVCVLYMDGTIKVFAPSQFDAEREMAAGAYQAWDFGPGLMTPEGKAIAKFGGGIAGLNPRTAIGYFEPGHYAFVVVDGRQPGYSSGMTLTQLAALFEELGCKVAYNLDGGQTSEMVYGGRVVNQPYRGGRPVSDIIFVGE